MGSELGGISVKKWQREWDQTTKGEITKEYFPVVADRLKTKIKLPKISQTWSRGTAREDHIYRDLK
jgi:hypothetical protein